MHNADGLTCIISERGRGVTAVADCCTPCLLLAETATIVVLSTTAGINDSRRSEAWKRLRLSASELWVCG
jgi:hypothetical protein